MGAYEIIRPLARGGMAELFLVRAVGLEGFEKQLVLKRILPHFAENPRFIGSFLDEAKLVAGFDHPNIAHVHDMGLVDGSYFFTMEYVHGVDVRTLLKRCIQLGTKLPIELVVLIGRSIASALHYAHERRGPDGAHLGLVHRDISPSNIIVSYDGTPKLIDFGVAKAASSTFKTQTGALKGKVSYMSPEQAKGASLDRRTDLFALGIVLWEMLTCKRLYKSENDLATIQRIIYQSPPSPRIERADCSPELERIVLRALSLDINARYQTAQEIQIELEELALEQRMKQSSIALSRLMQDMFADEMRAEREQQAGTPTVTGSIAAPPNDDETHRDSLAAAEEADESDDGFPAAQWPAGTASGVELVTAFQGSPAPAVPNVGREASTSSNMLDAPVASEPAPPELSRSRLRWTLGAVAAVVVASAAFVATRPSDNPASIPSQKDPETVRLHEVQDVPHVAPVPETPAASPAAPSIDQEARTTPSTSKPAIAKPATTKRAAAVKPTKPRVEPKRAEPPKPKGADKPKQPAFDPNAVFPP